MHLECQEKKKGELILFFSAHKDFLSLFLTLNFSCAISLAELFERNERNILYSC